MKRLICIVLILVTMFCSAYADSTSFMISYNSFASIYGAPEITKTMLKEETKQKICFENGTMQIIFATINSTEINSVIVADNDSADFLPACVCAAMCLHPSTKDTLQSLGNILYSYLSVKSGEKSSFGFFGGLYFNMDIVDGKYRFAIGDV